MRKMCFQAILMAMIMLFALPNLHAQEKVYVRGVIRDEKGNPLGGATIAEKDHPNNGDSQKNVHLGNVEYPTDLAFNIEWSSHFFP